MKRLTLSLICVLAFVGMALSASSVMADDHRSDNVTVSFGLWDPNKSDLMGAPLDRLLGDPAMGVGVNDIIIPNRVTIKEGDTVNFIIGGGHVLTIYDDGTRPGDIDTSVTEPITNCAITE